MAFTPSSPGLRVVSASSLAGSDFPTIRAAVRNLVSNYDCVAAGHILRIEYTDSEDLGAVEFRPGNVSDQFYVQIVPAPGLGAFESNGNGPLVYPAVGPELTFNTDSAGTMLSGVAIDNSRIRVIGTGTQTRGACYFQRNSGTLIQGFRHCIFDVQSPNQRIFEAGSGYGNCMADDCFVIMRANATGVFFASYGNPYMSIRRTTFHRLGGTGPFISDLFYGDVRDNVFSNHGTVAISGSLAVNTLNNNISDSPNELNVAAITKVAPGSMLVDLTTDLRPKLNGPLIGAGSDSAKQTYDVRGNYRGIKPDLGGAMYQAAVAPAKPNTTITSVERIGQKIIVKGTFNDVADSSIATLNASSTVAGNTGQTLTGQVVITGNSFVATFLAVKPGSYDKPVILFTNMSGTGVCNGGDPVVVPVPAAPTVVITSQTRNGTHVKVSGKVTNFPTNGTLTMVPLASNPNGAVSKSISITIYDSGLFEADIDVTSGNYDKPSVSVTNATATVVAYGTGSSVFSNGSAPSGYPAVDLLPYVAPTFNSPSLADGGLLTTLKLENTSGYNRVSQYYTFGLVFPQGAMKFTDGLNMTDPVNGPIPLQVDAKSTWQDGSLRHAIISSHVNGFAPAEVRTVTLLRNANPVAATPVAITDYNNSQNNPAPKLTLTQSGVVYTADFNAALNAANAKIETWLSGQHSTEWQLEVPLLNNGAQHPGLHVYMHMRWAFNGRASKLDVIVENCDAYSPNLHDYTYDAVLNVKGTNIYTITNLTHFARARWKKSFIDLLSNWVEAHDVVNVQFDPHYLIGTKMFPNYEVPDSLGDPLLNALYGDQVYTTGGGGYDVGPMRNGKYAPGMGTTGGRDDIGLHPRWCVDWLVSQDKRARKFSLYHADIGGSWSAHLRDRSSGPANGLFLDVNHWPYASDIGTDGDCLNPATGKIEAFKFIAGSATYMEADVSHHPAFAQMAYTLTGDRYYLDELLCWASFSNWHQNPYYRSMHQGLIQTEQVRGQAWGMRDFGDLATLLPDNSVYKPFWNYVLNSNIDWYTKTYYDNVNYSPLGAIITGNAFGYAVNGSPTLNGVSTWMDAFYTSAIGHIVEMGYTQATNLLSFKGRLSIGCMTDPEYCDIFAATYGIALKDPNNGAMFTTFGQAYRATQTTAMQSMPWYSQAMADQYDSEIPNAPGSTHAGEIPGFAYTGTGYPSNLQSGLTFAVDYLISIGDPRGLMAWERFMARTLQPNYAISGLQFDIVPRLYDKSKVQHPGAVTNLTAKLNANNTVTVTGTAPAYTGNSPLTKFTVHCSDGTMFDSQTPNVTVPQSTAAHANYWMTASNVSGEGPHSTGSNWIAGTNSTGPTDPIPTVTSVVVTPKSATGNQKFSATVLGVNNPSQIVNWTCNAGKIDANGNFTAPDPTNASQTVIVTAKSSADSNFSDTATVIIAPITSNPPTPIITGISVTPNVATVSGNGTRQFSAVVNGSNNPPQGVSWTASAGQIDANGNFIAPSATNVSQQVTITAKSTSDATKTGTATVTVPAATSTPTMNRSVSLTLRDADKKVLANLINLSWVVHSELIPSQYTAPHAQGSGAVTDANGLVKVNFTSTLPLDTAVRFEVSDTDGTLTQNPPARSFVGFVKVAA